MQHVIRRLPRFHLSHSVPSCNTASKFFGYRKADATIRVARNRRWRCNQKVSARSSSGPLFVSVWHRVAMVRGFGMAIRGVVCRRSRDNSALRWRPAEFDNRRHKCFVAYIAILSRVDQDRCCGIILKQFNESRCFRLLVPPKKHDIFTYRSHCRLATPFAVSNRGTDLVRNVLEHPGSMQQLRLHQR